LVTGAKSEAGVAVGSIVGEAAAGISVAEAGVGAKWGGVVVKAKGVTVGRASASVGAGLEGAAWLHAVKTMVSPAIHRNKFLTGQNCTMLPGRRMFGAQWHAAVPESVKGSLAMGMNCHV
jgi:hypothetical protein